MEALSSAIGDALNEFAGGVSTRTTQTFATRTTVLSGSGLGPIGQGAESADGITVTFAAAVDLTDVLSGDIFRALSITGLATQEQTIDTVNPTSLVLTAPGFGAAFADSSYEIVRPAETTLNVESTFEFPTATTDDPGTFIANDTLYQYTGKTQSTSDGTLTGVTYLDSEGNFQTGTPESLPPLTEIVDFTRAFSAVDILRRSIFVRTATAEDLEVLGRNLGVNRSAVQPESEYRRLIEVMAYTHRGTLKAIEDALTVLFGAGNFEVFEDLTGGRGFDDPIDVPFNNPATVYIRVTGDATTFNGKGFINGLEYALLNADRASTDIDTDLVHPSEARVVSAQLAPDPLPEQTVVRGVAGTLTCTAASCTFTAAAGAVFGDVNRNDQLVIAAGARQGERYVIRSRNDPTNTTLTLEPEDQISATMPTTGTLTVDTWRVVRPDSIFQGFRPSALSRETYPSSGVTEPMFEYSGAGTEATEITVNSDIGIAFTNTANQQTYFHRARILSGSSGFVEWQIEGETADFTGTPRDHVFQINDGTRTYSVALQHVAGSPNTLSAGITSNAFTYVVISGVTNPITSIVSFSGSTEATFTLRLIKDADREWSFAVNGQVLQRVEYAAAFLSPDPVTTTAARFEFGVFRLAASAVGYSINRCRWQFTTPEDFMNQPISATVSATVGQATTTQVVDAGAGGHITSAQESLRITDWAVANASGGLPTGEWVIDSAPNTNTALVTGRRRSGARTSTSNTDVIFMTREAPCLRYPDHKGMHIELLTGPNAGIYTISELLYADLTPIEAAASPIPTQTKAFLDTNKAADADFTSPLVARACAVRVSDAPTGGFTATQEIDFRILPVFAAQTAPAEIVGTGTFSSPTVTHRLVDINRDTPNAQPIMQIRYATTLSAQLWETTLTNAVRNTTDLTHYPFYLFDSTGYGRDFIELLVVAGVIPEFFGLIRDASGPHIIS